MAFVSVLFLSLHHWLTIQSPTVDDGMSNLDLDVRGDGVWEIQAPPADFEQPPQPSKIKIILKHKLFQGIIYVLVLIAVVQLMGREVRDPNNKLKHS